jgi:small subunit ribosomal protein S6
MKNYELVLMFSVGEDTLTNQTIDKYKSVITENNGLIDRYEDWGSLKMSYDINNENKARYILINFKADNNIIDQLNELIKFNDHILRHLIINTKESETGPSFMNKEQLKSA